MQYICGWEEFFGITFHQFYQNGVQYNACTDHHLLEFFFHALYAESHSESRTLHIYAGLFWGEAIWKSQYIDDRISPFDYVNRF